MGEILGYCTLNGVRYVNYEFKETVKNQSEIEQHRAMLFEKHNLDCDTQVLFIIRQPKGGGLHC